MHVAFMIVGAILGASLGQFGGVVIGALLGAIIGFGWIELAALRRRLTALELTYEHLRRGSADTAPRAEPAPSPARHAPPPEPEDLSAADPIDPVAIEPVKWASIPSPPPRIEASAAPPSARASLLAAVTGFFTGGNTLVRVGIVVLFFGVAFLLRYVAEHSHVPIEFRLSGVALGAVALMVLGWRLRVRRAGYAFALQGGGVGILYLTVFAALRLYALLPPAVAFALLAAIAGLSAVLAILQNSQAFALLGVTGGFLAPVLASTGQGSHVALFSYFLVLNAGIVTVAWFKSWRPLNVCGFLFTFAIATSWGVLKYRSEDFASTEPFLVAFFLFYLTIAVLFALRQPKEMRGWVDGTLVFGTPLAAFGLQTGMLHDDSMALAYSSLALSAIYLSLAFALRRHERIERHLLIESLLALGVVFLTLAIPLALGNRLNAAAWAVEGAGLLYVGCRQGRLLARALGSLLLLAAAGLLFKDLDTGKAHWLLPVASYAGMLLLSAASLLAAKILSASQSTLRAAETLYAPALFLVGLAAWSLGTIGMLPHWLPAQYELAGILGVLAVTASGLSVLARRLAVPYAAVSALGLLPAMWVIGIGCLVGETHAFAHGGWLAWPASFAIFYLVLARHEAALASGVRTALHATALWLGCLILGWEAGWQVGHALAAFGSDWSHSARLLLPALLLLELPMLTRRIAWPFRAQQDGYRIPTGLLLALALSILTLWVNATAPGNPYPLPYLPILNPLDVVQILVLMALYEYLRWLPRNERGESLGLPRGMLAMGLALLVFAWCNGVLLRSMHHWFGVPFDLESLLRSNKVETALSIFWSVLALTTMLFASRRAQRASWMTGAGLLAVVVVKLFFVDLSSVGSIERIISFVGVGLLMLIIGYFSPLPPRTRTAA